MTELMGTMLGLGYIAAGLYWSEWPAISTDERVARRIVWALAVPVALCYLF